MLIKTGDIVEVRTGNDRGTRAKFYHFCWCFWVAGCGRTCIHHYWASTISFFHGLVANNHFWPHSRPIRAPPWAQF